jgi:hypothetical protein
MTIDSLKSSIAVRLLLCCGIAVLSAFLMRGVIRFNPLAKSERSITADFVTENGFKFDAIVNDPEMWSGPRIGFSLDTANLEDQQQQALSPIVESEKYTMLLALDRQCPVCNRSGPYLKEVREQLAQRGIKYCLVSFKNDRPEDFFTFAKHLDSDSPSFVWTSRNTLVPSTLALMVVPTHLLVDNQHRIRGIWPGAAEGGFYRTRMTQQIIRDVDAILTP